MTIAGMVIGCYQAIRPLIAAIWSQIWCVLVGCVLYQVNDEPDIMGMVGGMCSLVFLSFGALFILIETHREQQESRERERRGHAGKGQGQIWNQTLAVRPRPISMRSTWLITGAPSACLSDLELKYQEHVSMIQSDNESIRGKLWLSSWIRVLFTVMKQLTYLQSMVCLDSDWVSAIFMLKWFHI